MLLTTICRSPWCPWLTWKIIGVATKLGLWAVKIRQELHSRARLSHNLPLGMWRWPQCYTPVPIFNENSFINKFLWGNKFVNRFCFIIPRKPRVWWLCHSFRISCWILSTILLLMQYSMWFASADQFGNSVPLVPCCRIGRGIALSRHLWWKLPIIPHSIAIILFVIVALVKDLKIWIV